MNWIVTKRSDWNEGVCTKRYVVGREGELRGICECWDAGDAERIAAALNTAPFPGTPADAVDNLLTAGGILVKTIQNVFDHDSDIPIENLMQVQNALQYWKIVSEKTNPQQPQGEPS